MENIEDARSPLPVINAFENGRASRHRRSKDCRIVEVVCPLLYQKTVGKKKGRKQEQNNIVISKRNVYETE